MSERGNGWTDRYVTMITRRGYHAHRPADKGPRLHAATRGARLHGRSTKDALCGAQVAFITDPEGFDCFAPKNMCRACVDKVMDVLTKPRGPR